MISTNKERAVFRIKDGAVGHGEMQIVKQKYALPLVAQILIRTRIRKDNESKYTNAPSREIKGWFESRKIKAFN